MPSSPFQPTVLWLTGYSGAGKTTIAARLKLMLEDANCAVVVLDGDEIRRGLCSDLGFSERDRAENVRRVAEVARFMVSAGMVVIVALISPLRKDRETARAKFAVGEFVEIFVDTPLAVAEARDVKGLYRRARAGQLPQFTGIDAAYEAPSAPEIHIPTLEHVAADAAAKIIGYLRNNRHAV